MAVWSALGGGAACAVVAGIAMQSAGGFAPLLAKFNPPKPLAIIAPTPTLAPQPSVKPAEAPTEALAFDVVRVETSGESVIAGHSAPHASVELRDGGKALAKVDADDRGQFVLIPDPLGAGDHKLQLAARVGDSPETLSKVVGVMVAAANPLARPVAPAPAPTLASVARPPPSPSPLAAAAPKPSKGSEPEAPRPALSAAPIATRVVPAPAASPTAVAMAEHAAAPAPGATPPTMTPEILTVTRVTTTNAGGLEAVGTANAGARLRLKLNGSYVADVTADPDGHWALSVQRGLATGFYALRAEALDAAESAKAFAEASFAFAQRPAPIVVANAEPSLAPEPEKATTSAPSALAAIIAPTPSPRTAAPSADAVQSAATAAPTADPSHAIVSEILTTTVVKGDNLWDLARHYYGDGLRYADIFHANANQIRNPNLIFIGQVFVVPQQETKRD